jgi:hypothetical protein
MIAGTFRATLYLSHVSLREASKLRNGRHIVNLSTREKHLFPNQGFQRMVNLRKLLPIFSVAMLSALLMAAGYSNTRAKQLAAPSLPVKTEPIKLSPIPQVGEHVANVKLRRSTIIQPQVDRSLTRILKVMNV